MNKSLLTLALATLVAGTASATSYYITTPLIPDSTLNTLDVNLRYASLPRAIVGDPYSFDFNSLLTITGDNEKSGVISWYVNNSSLPSGLSFRNGVLSGIPTENLSKRFSVKALYKSDSGSQTYNLDVAFEVRLLELALPEAIWGSPYAASLLPALDQSKGAPTELVWSLLSGPSNLSLGRNDGQLTGVLEDTTSFVTIEVEASAGQESSVGVYTIPLKHILKEENGVKHWSDGSYASNCKEYLAGSEGKAYAGATGDGVYRIATTSGHSDVYCDMTHDGGGWMLVYTQKGAHTPFAARNTATVTPQAGGSLATMGQVFNNATEFRWTDMVTNRFLQGRTHMPTWYQKFTTQACNTAGNTIQVHFEGGWLNTATQPRLVESCTLYPFGMRNNTNYAGIRDIPGYNNETTHMCWFDDNVLDRPFSGSHDDFSIDKSYCTQFSYNFPATAARGGTMDYMVWVR